MMMPFRSIRSAAKRINARLGVADWVMRAMCSAMLLGALGYEQFAAPRNALREGFVWSALFLVASWSYGTLIVRSLRLRLDHGLKLLTGASALVCMGGWAMSMGFFRPILCSVLLFVGTIGAIFLIWTQGGSTKRTDAPSLAAWCLGGAVVSLCLLVALTNWHMHPADDGVAYLAFPEKILSTGSFIEPLSLRRLSALGGQTVLLAYLWPHLDPEQAFVADQGVGLALLLLQIAFWPHASLHRSSSSMFLRIAAAVFASALVVLGINTASLLTGAAWLVGLIRIAARARISHSLPYWVVTALVAAALSSLRQFFILPAVLCILSVALRERGAVRLLQTTALAGAAACGFAVSAVRSSGTFLYPLLGGKPNPATSLSAALSPFVVVRAWRLIERPAIFACVLVAGIAMFGAKRNAPRSVVLWAGGISSAIILAVLAVSDVKDVERYVIPIVAACTFAVALGFPGLRSANGARAIVCGAVLLVGAATLKNYATDTPEQVFRSLSIAWDARPRSGRTETWEAIELRKAQAVVSPGSPIFAAVDDPVWLDFRRNPISLADMPGYVGGLPTLQGPAALAEFLLGRGLRYVLYVRPEFSKDYFRGSMRQQMLATDHILWRTMAVLTIDFSENLRQLERAHPVLYDKDGLVVMDLGALR